MKFTLRPVLARVSLAAMISVLVLELSGRFVKMNNGALACPGWPFCYPAGINGWLGFGHRLFALLSGLFFVLLIKVVWKKYRDHIILLPLTIVVLFLFMANIFAGAANVVYSPPPMLTVVHSLTGIILWISLFTLVLASGYYGSHESDFLPRVNFRERLKDLFILTKPIIVALLLVTTVGGMVAGSKAIPPLSLVFWTLLGGALAAGGAGALNQFIDRDLDKQMQRTANRPLAAKRMFPSEGLAFGLVLSVASIYVFVAFVNLLAALLAIAGIFYYVWLYSILLKRNTAQNIVIGGGAGAIPPMVGWAAATGHLSIAAWFLFAIIFFWTPPHFWALSIVRKKDYERAGIPMLPVAQGEKETRRQIWLYTLWLVVITLLMPVLKLAGTLFFVSALILGIWLVGAARKVYKGEGNKVAWKLYRYSSMYLMFIFLALVMDSLL